MAPRPFISVALLALFLAGGCRDREITTYRAPKDPAPALSGVERAAPANTNDLPRDHPPVGLPAEASAKEGATAPGDPMAGATVPTGSDRLVWTAPAHWAAKPAGAMRKGSYAIKGDGAEADLSITAFPGDTGGLLANVNRWRGQLALPPLAADQLDANRAHLDLGALHVDVVEFAGTANGAPARILGAIVPLNGETWFFKLMGPDALVAREKPAFLGFLNTVHPR